MNQFGGFCVILLLEMWQRLIRFLRDWTLPVGMIAGAASYLILSRIDALTPYKSELLRGVAIVQPFLIFCMLFLTFCRIRLSDFQWRRWYLPMLVFQTVGFVLCCLPVMSGNLSQESRLVAECGMLCLICPTATAAAVVTRKLGGDMASVTSYTMLINIVAAVLFPAVVPLIHQGTDGGFVANFIRILYHTFPMLILPMIAAGLLRRIWPSATEWIAQWRDMPFYLWAVSLSLAIAVSVRSLVNSRCGMLCLAGIALCSLTACAIQFAFGRWLGRREKKSDKSETVSATQACGQKNTVLIIWLGYTFLPPVTSLAGGFYCIWHNVYNSYQLYQQRKTSA